jgi:hypothetical protein
VRFARGVPHVFRVDSEIAHVLTLSTPGGHEESFRTAGDPVGTPAGPPDFARMSAAADAAAGFAILGPPPFES